MTTELNGYTKYLGCKEGGNLHKEIIDYWNKNKPAGAYTMTYQDPWCACFASVMYMMAGCGEMIPLGTYCPAMVEEAKKKGQWKKNKVVPEYGDLVFYDWDGDGVSDHVGIVLDYTTSGKVRAVEGNASDTVKIVERDWASGCIMGYVEPLNIATKKADPEFLTDSVSVSYSVRVPVFDNAGTGKDRELRGVTVKEAECFVWPDGKRASKVKALDEHAPVFVRSAIEKDGKLWLFVRVSYLRFEGRKMIRPEDNYFFIRGEDVRIIDSEC